MKYLSIVILTLSSYLVFGQYPFEKYPEPVYKKYKDWKSYDWSKSKTKKTYNHTLSINQFFDNQDTLTIQLTSFTENDEDSSIIRIFHNKTQIQKIHANTFFSPLNVFQPTRVADIDGNGLKDLKINIPSMGNGVAGLYTKIIYLFQKEDKTFVKVSFTDMMDENRSERDFDNDGNHEIITMNLINHENHNYWTFNIFEYKNNELTNVNHKGNYPIMIQYLHKKNYTITEKISRDKMKNFTLKTPDDYDRVDTD